MFKKLKDKLFEKLYPEKQLEITNLNQVNSMLVQSMQAMETATKKEPTMAETLNKIIGMDILPMDNADAKGRPPLPYQDLEADGRKNYVAHLESIYQDDRFQEMYKYAINVFGNHALLSDKEDAINNGRIGIVVMKTFMTFFENAHSEFLDQKKSEEEFDEFETLPE